jgi:hypothetical protein
MEQHRLARESCAFLATLEAAMGTVLDGVGAAREKFANGQSTGHSPLAYTARQQIKKTVFADLRSACLRLGSDLTGPFLRLDNDIDFFAAEWINEQTTSGIPRPIGVNTGLLDHLVRIEQQAVSLRDEARKGQEHVAARLQETQGSDLL